MRRVFVAACLAVAAVGAGAVASAEGAPPVVIELFTSQGDRMCAPADKILAKMAGRPDIVALSLPVDAWDMLGWKDTLATDANSKRQRAYATALGKGAVYTPQMIIDGAVDVVGSREAKVKTAIASERAIFAACRDKSPSDGKCRSGCPTGVSVAEVAQNRLRVSLRAAPAGCRRNAINATVWLFSLRDNAAVAVTGGENKGRTLKYRNVVRAIESLGVWRGEAMTFDVRPAPSADGVAVVVQQDGFGPVLGAAYFATVRRYARQ